MMKIIGLMIKRECLLSFRKIAEYSNSLLFFIVVAILFPLAITPELNTLRLIGPGIIWISALLATLLSLNNLFYEDYHDGSLEQLIVSPYPLSLLLFTKILVHWLITGLPLILLSPLLGSLFHLSPHAIFILALSLLLGTPTLSLIGAIGSALTVGLRNNGLLLALIILPLYIPILIFSTSAVLEADIGQTVTAQLALLTALLAMALTLAPLTTAFALQIGVSYDA